MATGCGLLCQPAVTRLRQPPATNRAEMRSNQATVAHVRV